MKKFLLFSFLFLSACTFSGISSDALINQTEKQIIRRFGEPTIKRTEYPYQLWSYRQNDCSLLLYFDETRTVRFVDFSGNCQLSP